MKKQDLEKVLNLNLAGHTIVFAFPGMGIGNRYPELSGCTLEVNEMEKIAKTFCTLDINFIGISTGKLPDQSEHIQYMNIEENIPFFSYIHKGDKLFIDRFTLLIHDDNIVEKKIDNVLENSLIVKKWIERLKLQD